MARRRGDERFAIQLTPAACGRDFQSMAKIDFMEWLDRETARRGIDEKEIAALVDQMTVEDQLTALRLKRGISQKTKSERGRL